VAVGGSLPSQCGANALQDVELRLEGESDDSPLGRRRDEFERDKNRFRCKRYDMDSLAGAPVDIFPNDRNQPIIGVLGQVDLPGVALLLSIFMRLGANLIRAGGRQ
jgi:hypothetical protein